VKGCDSRVYRVTWSPIGWRRDLTAYRGSLTAIGVPFFGRSLTNVSKANEGGQS
jgi:hypothetical protein